MPDVRGSLIVTAGVGTPSRASVGATAPAVLRPNSVAVGVQPIGTTAPTNAPGAGVLSVATVPAVPAVLAVADPFNAQEIENLQRRQLAGGRPSGLSEAIRELREAYRNRERSAADDTREAVAAALAIQEAAVRRYNEIAARNGLPTIQAPSDVLGAIVDDEGHSIGDPAGLGGILIGSEVMPAWRSDP